MAGIMLVVADFIISFMWVWSSVLVKIFVYKVLGFEHDFIGEIVKCCVYIINMFFFAYLGKIMNGASYNPLTIFPDVVVSRSVRSFLFVCAVRMPAQCQGSIFGVITILAVFPEMWNGPSLTVDLYRGALTEGILAFAIVFLSLGLYKNMPGSFFRKTWISSVAKLTLQILGSDLTGGAMNPASVMGWACARDEHVTKVHILVYWLAPLQGTAFAAKIFNRISKPTKEEAAKKTD